MGMALYLLAVLIATFSAALFWRPAGAAFVLFLAIVLAMAAPFVYLSTLAIRSGEPFSKVFDGMALIWPAMQVITIHWIFWALVALLAGAGTRAGWMLLRRVRT